MDRWVSDNRLLCIEYWVLLFYGLSFLLLCLSVLQYLLLDREG
jgi:hypothetical protein